MYWVDGLASRSRAGRRQRQHHGVVAVAEKPSVVEARFIGKSGNVGAGSGFCSEAQQVFKFFLSMSDAGNRSGTA